MAKGAWCQISNCQNRLTGKGRICGTHKARKSMTGSYDLSTYTGIPNYLPECELPDGILKLCPTHGELYKDGVYAQWYKGNITSYNCRKCTLGNNIRSKFEGMNNIEDYERILESQGGVCASCGGLNTTTRNGKVKRFAVDHDHKTGKTRELLCAFCNAINGYAKDSIRILQCNIDYLKKHGITE